MAKLGRARNKSQYLRIQAETLSESHPQQSLRLLEQYFELGEHFEFPQAYLIRAEAHLALGNIAPALEALKSALSYEKEHPGFRTQAYLRYPFLIASRKIEDLFDEAFQVLHDHKDEPIFHMDHYYWNGAKALMFSARSQRENARTFARLAIKAAQATDSGFRYHPTYGLFRKQNEDQKIHKRLLKLAK